MKIFGQNIKPLTPKVFIEFIFLKARTCIYFTPLLKGVKGWVLANPAM
jgi:hypothetical protein